MENKSRKYKEIEIKIIDINIDGFKKKLENIGAFFLYNKTIEDYFFDYPPIRSQFLSILDTINNVSGKKEYKLAFNKLMALFYDVDNLLLNTQKTKLSKYFHSNSLVEILKNKGINNIIHSSIIKEIMHSFSTNPNKWLRLRKVNDENISISAKQIFNRKIDGNQRTHNIEDQTELEVLINDFQKGKELLSILGFFPKTYVKKTRIFYKYGANTTIAIDIYEHIPPYAEIEANSKQEILTIVEKLNLEKEKIKGLNNDAMNTDDLYSYYGLNIEELTTYKDE